MLTTAGGVDWQCATRALGRVPSPPSLRRRVSAASREERERERRPFASYIESNKTPRPQSLPELLLLFGLLAPEAAYVAGWIHGDSL